MPLDNESYKVNITHSNTTNPERVTVNATGLYQISYSAIHLGGAGTGYTRLVVNGTTEIPGSYVIGAVSAASYSVSTSTTVVIPLNQNDFVTLQGATTGNTFISNNNGPTATNASAAVMTVVRLN